MQGAEIFVPKSPSVKISDLADSFAKVLDKKVTQKVTGVRPGEKIHEILITKDDAHHTFELDDCYAICPPSDASYPNAHKVAESFSLASDTNPLFLHDAADIEHLVREYLK
jgi:UDP-N-acetylglucosamine 4,6-dehydratase/5-epimerase